MPAENEFRQLIRQHMRALRAAKFGLFAHSVQAAGPIGLVEGPIQPGVTATFVFDLPGSYTFDATDWTSLFSDNPPGNTPAIVAAKFIRGPSDDSAFGATETDPQDASIVLSELSSDATDPAVLDATLHFGAGPGGGQMQLTVQNTGTYEISEVYFNGPDGVDLNLVAVIFDVGPAGPWEYTGTLT